MKRTHIPLVVGNWKMNPQNTQKAQTLFIDSKKAIGTKNAVAQVAIAAPTLFIGSLEKLSQKSRIKLGAQDVSFEELGAHTGDIALSMLKSVGVTYVIVGHSERRAHGETDEVVSKKTGVVLQGGQTAIVCVGEKVRDARGDYFNVVESQVKSLLLGLKKSHLSRLVIAYEPIWAIGTDKHATAEDVQEMKLFIQKIIADVCGRSMVLKVRIIYGGSVNKDNAKELLEVGNADGFLVGGASLKPTEFASIVHISDTYGKA
jgi:triosephosphate isomerase